MQEKYDVVIIGAGIGGLVCGCYLAKAGLRVLIVEKNDKPGGYCTSFERDGYRFDVGIHYLGGIKRGILGKILKELEVKDKIKFNQIDPTDKIIMPNNICHIRANPYDTIEEFKKNFPKEKITIERFFKFIMEEDLLKIYKKIANLTFKKLLDGFFEDYKLKATLGILSANLGLPPSQISAVAAFILFKEFILDPGYYPIGGMGKFSFVLAQYFKKYGGHLILNKKVEKLLVKKDEVKEVIVEKNEPVRGKFIVSNIDATYLFNNLIKKNTIEREKIKYLKPSSSLFVVYLGLKDEIGIQPICNYWVSSTYDINFNKKNNIEKINFFMLSFPFYYDNSKVSNFSPTLQIYLVVPFISESFWKRKKKFLMERVIAIINEKYFSLNDKIKIKLCATPADFYKITFNKQGSTFGWSSIPAQIFPHVFPQETSLRNLILVGQWCTTGSGQGGIPKVAFTGKKASEIILRRFK